jgi:hypothetical protein
MSTMCQIDVSVNRTFEYRGAASHLLTALKEIQSILGKGSGASKERGFVGKACQRNGA